MNKLKITLGAIIVVLLGNGIANANTNYGAGGRYAALDFYRLNCGSLTWSGIAAYSDAKNAMNTSDYNGAKSFLSSLVMDYGIGGTCTILKTALPPIYFK